MRLSSGWIDTHHHPASASKLSVGFMKREDVDGDAQHDCGADDVRLTNVQAHCRSVDASWSTNTSSGTCWCVNERPERNGRGKSRGAHEG